MKSITVFLLATVAIVSSAQPLTSLHDECRAFGKDLLKQSKTLSKEELNKYLVDKCKKLLLVEEGLCKIIVNERIDRIYAAIQNGNNENVDKACEYLIPDNESFLPQFTSLNEECKTFNVDLLARVKQLSEKELLVYLERICFEVEPFWQKCIPFVHVFFSLILIYTKTMTPEEAKAICDILY